MIMTKTAEHYNDEYLQAARLLRSRQRDVVKVFVEDMDDQPFWRTYFKTICPDKECHVDYYKKNEHAQRGEDYMLKEVKRGKLILGKNLLLCVDNDYNPWLTNYLHCDEKCENPYIIHTYWHSIESFHCHHKNLERYHFMLTQEASCSFDYQERLEEISKKVYPLFVLLLTSFEIARRPNQGVVYSHESFTDDIRHVVEDFAGADRFVDTRMTELRELLENDCPYYQSKEEDIVAKLIGAGYTEKDCCVLMQGHALLEGIVYPLFEQVVNPIHLDKLASMVNDQNLINAYIKRTYEEIDGNEKRTLEKMHDRLERLVMDNNDVLIEPAASQIVAQIRRAFEPTK